MDTREVGDKIDKYESRVAYWRWGSGSADSVGTAVVGGSDTRVDKGTWSLSCGGSIGVGTDCARGLGAVRLVEIAIAGDKGRGSCTC